MSPCDSTSPPRGSTQGVGEFRLILLTVWHYILTLCFIFGLCVLNWILRWAIIVISLVAQVKLGFGSFLCRSWEIFCVSSQLSNSGVPFCNRCIDHPSAT